jgi:hypothetical protein
MWSDDPQLVNSHNGGARSYPKRKVIYFDSNDEMFYESEISDCDLTHNGNHKNFTKVTLKATEEERRAMR